MTFLPIVRRELRVASRRRATYWIRSVAGFLMVAAGASLFVMVQREPPKEAAMYLFVTLTAIAVLYALLSGIRSTSDCLSQEKRDGTLGLLFLTDLRGYDVVLGKLAANSLNAFYSVAAVLPMLAIPLLMGGVTAAEFARMALVVLNALFFSLAVGIGVSAVSRSAQRAAWVTAAIITGASFLAPLCALVLSLSGGGAKGNGIALLPSTAFTYYQALDFSYRKGSSPFWLSLLSVQVVAWCALLWASLVVPRTWQDKPAGSSRLRWRERLQAWSGVGGEGRLEFRRRLLDENPFCWLIARARGRTVAVWGFLALVGCAWAWGLAKYRREWLNEGMYLATTLLLNFVLRCWVASEATRQLSEDRKAGVLELLLCTPLSVGEILRGQRLALIRQFFGPTAVILAIECVFMVATARDSGEPTAALWYALYAGVMLMLVADLAAIYWVGMWQGLSARSQTFALNGTLARVLVWPWAGLIGVVILVSLLSLENINLPQPEWTIFLGAWFLSGVFSDLAFAAAARKRLLGEFRLAAQHSYSQAVPWWRRLTGVGPALEAQPGPPAQRPATTVPP